MEQMDTHGHKPPDSGDRSYRDQEGHRDEDAVVAALRGAGLLVRVATSREDRFEGIDAWVRDIATGQILPVDITTRVRGVDGWEAKRSLALGRGVVWLAVPRDLIDRAVLAGGTIDAGTIAWALAEAITLARRRLARPRQNAHPLCRPARIMSAFMWTGYVRVRDLHSEARVAYSVGDKRCATARPSV